MSSDTLAALVPFVVVLLLIAWFIALFNGLVRTRNTVNESWADIDTELKRRHDLIPSLVETVRGYAAHERQTLQAVVAARAAASAGEPSPSEAARRETALGGSLRTLLAVSERYPDLKADAHFLELQRELANTEDRIQRSRRFYNANVRDLNTRIDVFPGNLVARLFHFARREHFELQDAAERAAPGVDLAR
jgi:LemA protein